jgi:hypothetical protein
VPCAGCGGRGARWSSSARRRTRSAGPSRGADTHGHTDARILGERTLTIAGRALRCYDVQRDTTLTRAIQGTQHERACWNPSLGMTLTDDQTFQGTYQGIRFEAQATFTLRSPP